VGRIMTNRRLIAAIITAVLIAGCGDRVGVLPAPTAAPRVPAAQVGGWTPAPISTMALTPTPTQTHVATATPRSVVTPAPTPSPAPTLTPAPTPTPTPSSWRQVPSQSSVSGQQFRDVTWTGTRFVAIGSRGFLDSSDGVRWRQQKGKTPAGADALAAGPGGVVAVGLVGELPASWFSRDGLKWTARSKAFPMPRLGSDGVRVTDVVARGDGWLAVGRRDPFCPTGCGDNPIRSYVWTSKDGLHWTRVADQKTLKGGGINSVAQRGEGFVAVGAASDHVAIWTSPDGLAWSRVPDKPMFREPKGSDWTLSVNATGVAVRGGITVAVGMAYAQDTCPPGVPARLCPGARAWWSADGRTWSKATVQKGVDGQMFSVTATPDGFLATGPSGGRSCLGGIWASTDGRAWRCVASSKSFKGFGPYAAAASETVEVAVGLTDAGWDEESGDGMPGAAWYHKRG
jgi:hypothetical protein